jgi:hypothetical protein
MHLFWRCLTPLESELMEKMSAVNRQCRRHVGTIDPADNKFIFFYAESFWLNRTRPRLHNGKNSNKIRVKNLRASIPGLSFIKTRQTIVNSAAKYNLHAKKKSFPFFFTIPVIKKEIRRNLLF